MFSRRLPMENTPRLEETLLPVLSHPPTGWDRRPRHTWASTMVGLLPAGWSSLPAGGPAVERRAPDAQSTGRRLRRGLDQDQSERVALSGPLRPHACAAWGAHGLSGARETSLGWHPSCRRRRWKGARLSGARGQACGWPQVSSTDQREGPGQRAGARPHQRTAWWDGRSEAPTAAPPCEAYGLRVASAETFFADTSNGCPLA